MKGEIKYEGTLLEKFPALIRTQKKSKHHDFESVGLDNPELLLLENTVSVKEKKQQYQPRQKHWQKPIVLEVGKGGEFLVVEI